MEYVKWREKDAFDHDHLLRDLCVSDCPVDLEFHQRKKERKRYAPLPLGFNPAHPAGVAGEMKKEH